MTISQSFPIMNDNLSLSVDMACIKRLASIISFDHKNKFSNEGILSFPIISSTCNGVNER